MDPPVEKAEGDTDKDSGGQTFSIFIFIFFIFFQFVMLFLGTFMQISLLAVVVPVL